MVNGGVNGSTSNAKAVPFGVYKNSGVGRERGLQEIYSYTPSKSVGTAPAAAGLSPFTAPGRQTHGGTGHAGSVERGQRPRHQSRPSRAGSPTQPLESSRPVHRRRAR